MKDKLHTAEPFPSLGDETKGKVKRDYSRLEALVFVLVALTIVLILVALAYAYQPK